MITFHIGWPQGIMLGLILLGIIYTARRHGRPDETPNNIWIAIPVRLAIVALLYWGGFFK